MTLGFALRCVVTGCAAYKMIWTVTQRRNRKNFYSCVALPSKSFYMHFGRNTMQRKSLRHIINQPLGFTVVPLSSSSSSFSSSSSSSSYSSSFSSSSSSACFASFSFFSLSTPSTVTCTSPVVLSQ